MYNPIPNCNFIHSCYVPPSNNPAGVDAIVAMVKDVDTLESKLHIERDFATMRTKEKALNYLN